MKYKPNRSKKKPKESSRWMTTYADLITLILVFFILLFSMSQIDMEKFKAVAQSYKDRVIFDHNPSIIDGDYPAHKLDDYRERESDETKDEVSESDEEEIHEVEKEQNDDELDILLAKVRQFLTEEGLNDVIKANRTTQGVVLVLQEKVLFESGRAHITEEGKPFLNQVSRLLRGIPNNIKVEGHTDNRPIATTQFPSNWELSSARASSVIRYFIENHGLEDKRFQATGYADTKPVRKNDTIENRQKNRRVEIVILDIE
ncbi:flagellar motor protein MotS [Salirhabdus salicampi]|uniref:flagellar motor protein MotS n=1 Tax=Salirhabdus salicampi TaxID=476102 RepID=UPI0020C4A768|nr:flagellar motor protein MotS [Salirhabdus salicampi]MCP8617142.1 flagellar motor protein MotB [Salirhabdus salicampi]